MIPDQTTPIVSLILRTATRYVFPIMLLLSIYLMLRGHNEPGGGFIGGLLAATAFVLWGIAYDVDDARRLLRVEPRTLIAIGLLVGAGSGLPALAAGQPFLTGKWIEPSLPVLGTTKFGTPLLFDFGVYLAVIGVTLVIVLTLMEE